MRHTFAGVLSGPEGKILVVPGSIWRDTGKMEGGHWIFAQHPASVRLTVKDGAITVETKEAADWVLFSAYADYATLLSHYENGWMLRRALVEGQRPAWTKEESVSFSDATQVMAWFDQRLEEGDLS